MKVAQLWRGNVTRVREERFERRLRALDVCVGEGGRWNDPRSTGIDENRPTLVSIGDGRRLMVASQSSRMISSRA